MKKEKNSISKLPRISHELGYALGKIASDFQSIIKGIIHIYCNDKRMLDKITDIVMNIDKATSLARELSESKLGEKNITNISSFITDCEPFFEKARKSVCKDHENDLDFIEKILRFIKNSKERTRLKK